MVKSSTASGGIIHHVLTKDNYERWRSVMENYLKGQDLWDDIIIDKKKEPKKDQASKKMKEGKTFHIFQLSKASLNINFNNQNGLESNVLPDIEQ
ncbi:hypothetical protein L195_g038273, partial [Trifolium pratense]